jgi:hypothetical protein
LVEVRIVRSSDSEVTPKRSIWMIRAMEILYLTVGRWFEGCDDGIIDG